MPKLENWIITKNPTKSEVSRRVPGAGLEPARLIQPTDFKSAYEIVVKGAFCN